MLGSWPRACNPAEMCCRHTAAAMQTLKTENGHLWSLIEGHASAEGQWATRLQQDGSSLQALEAERRALRQQVRGCCKIHSHLQAACPSRRAVGQQVRSCPHRYLCLQAGCTFWRALAGMLWANQYISLRTPCIGGETAAGGDSCIRSGSSHCRWRPSAGSAATCQSVSRMHRSAERHHILPVGRHLSTVRPGTCS